MYDSRTEAILGTLKENPYPLSANTLVTLTEIPYPTVARRLATLVAEGVLVIDKMGGYKNRTAFYKIAEKDTPVTIKWLRDPRFNDRPLEDFTWVAAYLHSSTQEGAAIGPIGQALEKEIQTHVETIVMGHATAKSLAEDKARILNHIRTLKLYLVIAEAMVNDPTWEIGVAQTIVMRDPNAEELLKAFIKENESS